MESRCRMMPCVSLGRNCFVFLMAMAAVLTLGTSVFALHDYQKASKEQSKAKSFALKSRALDRCLLGLCLGVSTAVFVILTVGIVTAQADRPANPKSYTTAPTTTSQPAPTTQPAPISQPASTTPQSYETRIDQLMTDWNLLSCVKGKHKVKRLQEMQHTLISAFMSSQRSEDEEFTRSYCNALWDTEIWLNASRTLCYDDVQVEIPQYYPYTREFRSFTVGCESQKLGTAQ